MKDIILFGIQGSGKGTLGRTIAEKYGFCYFEMGAELRKLSQENSELSRKIKEIVESGRLVPDEVVMEIVQNFVDNLPDGASVVFDGLPRKTEQAKTFNELLQSRQRDYVGILIDVPEEIAIKRLTTRRICSKCKEVYPADYKKNVCNKCSGELVTRTDDNPESIKTRIHHYYEETIAVIDEYKNKKRLITMDGSVSISEAAKTMFQIVEKRIL